MITLYIYFGIAYLVFIATVIAVKEDLFDKDNDYHQSREKAIIVILMGLFWPFTIIFAIGLALYNHVHKNHK